MKKISLIVSLLLLVLFTSCSHIERNKKAGNTIVEKIELYKNANGFFPNSLQDIGYDEGLGIKGEYVCYEANIFSVPSITVINGKIFCYQRVDSVNYMVWFGTTLGEGIYYYSDTQQWEDRLD
jgi:hypothetical protein